MEKPAAFRLLPGIYDIRAQDHSVIQRPTVDIQDVEIVEGRTTERIANFATEGVLRVKAIKKNAPAKTYVKVFRQDDEKYMGDGWTREDGKAAEFKLLPGRYKVSFQDQSVAQRPVVWIENVEVKADQTVERFATFVEGGVLGVTANKNGSPYKAYVKVYQQQDDKYMGDGWTREDGKAAEYNLLPGAYYAKVEDRKDRSVREIRDIQVQSGKTITVSAAFPVAEEVRTTVKKPKTAPAPTPQTQPQAAPTPKTGSGGTAPSESGDQQGSSEAVMNGRAPLMDGAKVIKEMTYGPNTRVDLEIPATPEEIVNFYKQALTAKGWQLGMAMIQGNTGVLQLKKDGGQLVIKAQGQGQKSKVSMALMGQ
ncbi:MAG: hypothetical protein JXL84_00650 [Deltaproteobacteria bacterium]|nr:hypothetical protein [Deltaproteobacteria bacterium]